MAKFFTADEHYDDDEGILKYCNRPFANGIHMVSDIIHRHNEYVKPEDEVYHIGDFTFKNPADISFISSILRALNGTHILILGNHDTTNPFKLVGAGFRSVHTSLELEIDAYRVILAHDPSIWTVVPERTIFICGHIHKLFKSIPDKLVVNAGVDVHDYFPISFKQVLEELGLSLPKKL